jgi:hypothetical protein
MMMCEPPTPVKPKAKKRKMKKCGVTVDSQSCRWNMKEEAETGN